MYFKVYKMRFIIKNGKGQTEMKNEKLKNGNEILILLNNNDLISRSIIIELSLYFKKEFERNNRSINLFKK